MRTYYVAYTERVMFTYRVRARDFEEAKHLVIMDGCGEEVFHDSDGIVEGSIEDLTHIYEEVAE